MYVTRHFILLQTILQIIILLNLTIMAGFLQRFLKGVSKYVNSIRQIQVILNTKQGWFSSMINSTFDGALNKMEPWIKFVNSLFSIIINFLYINQNYKVFIYRFSCFHCYPECSRVLDIYFTTESCCLIYLLFFNLL